MTIDTQFPIVEEFVRVYPVDASGQIETMVFYAMQHFSMPMESLKDIVRETLIEANRRYSESPEARDQYLRTLVNHKVNLAMGQLEKAGAIVRLEELDTDEYVERYGEKPMVPLPGGYVAFNPAITPPTPSGVYH